MKKREKSYVWKWDVILDYLLWEKIETNSFMQFLSLFFFPVFYSAKINISQMKSNTKQHNFTTGLHVYKTQKSKRSEKKIIMQCTTHVSIKKINAYIVYSTERYFFSTDERFSLLASGELHIRDVRTSDSYLQYRCITRNVLTGDERTSDPATLYVIGAYPYQGGPIKMILLFEFHFILSLVLLDTSS